MPACLGLDYGLRRIGIEAGDTERRLALPLGAHVAGRDGPVMAHLRRLIAERDIRSIVLGLPLTADGRETAMAVRVRDFALLLERECGLPVILWDERFSTAEAARRLRETGRASREQRDAVAAAIILQNYLDSLAAPGTGAEP